MTGLPEIVAAMPPEQRKGALVVLDHMTRPLTAAEITAHLRRTGISLARARKIADAVKGLHIVALVGPGA